MKKETKPIEVGPIWTILFGVIISFIVFYLLTIFFVWIYDSVLKNIEFAQHVKMPICIALSLLLSIAFYFLGQGEEHPIPEWEEQKRKIKDSEKKDVGRKVEEIKTEKGLNIIPIATSADFVPPGFKGFFLVFGSVWYEIVLKSGLHWKIPILMKIEVVQTVPVSSGFIAIDYCRLKTKIETAKLKEEKENLSIGKLGGTTRFMANGLITTKVINIFKYFLLDTSTRKERLKSIVLEGIRDKIRSSSPEQLTNTTSKKKVRDAIVNVIKNMENEEDGNEMSIDELGIEVIGLNLDSLEPFDKNFQDYMLKIPEAQIDALKETIAGQNLANNIQRIKDLDIDPTKAAEILLAEDGKATITSNSEKEEQTINFNASGENASLLHGLNLIAKFTGVPQNRKNRKNRPPSSGSTPISGPVKKP